MVGVLDCAVEGGAHPEPVEAAPCRWEGTSLVSAVETGYAGAVGAQLATRLPAQVQEVFREFRTCEFSTLARDGTPITWPALPFYRPESEHFLITTSIGLPAKAFNIRREPRVSLLFSDPTGSGLTEAPAVLVQGEAVAPDEIVTSIRGFEKELLTAVRRQPSGVIYTRKALMRWAFDWYFMRLLITITPRRILVWAGGDFSRRPDTIEVEHVA
jgi:hypothetical protein